MRPQRGEPAAAAERGGGHGRQPRLRAVQHQEWVGGGGCGRGAAVTVDSHSRKKEWSFLRQVGHATILAVEREGCGGSWGVWVGRCSAMQRKG